MALNTLFHGEVPFSKASKRVIVFLPTVLPFSDAIVPRETFFSLGRRVVSLSGGTGSITKGEPRTLKLVVREFGSEFFHVVFCELKLSHSRILHASIRVAALSERSNPNMFPRNSIIIMPACTAVVGMPTPRNDFVSSAASPKRVSLFLLHTMVNFLSRFSSSAMPTIRSIKLSRQLERRVE